MENRTYLVTEAEKLTGEKAHVLRYWEDELGMEIHRNSLGHRCYTAQDIQIFLGIRELKKKGLHLKAIRELMPKLVQATAEIKAFPAEAAETAKEKPDPAIPGKADEVPEVVVDLLPEREAEQLPHKASVRLLRDPCGLCHASRLPFFRYYMPFGPDSQIFLLRN